MNLLLNLIFFTTVSLKGEYIFYCFDFFGSHWFNTAPLKSSREGRNYAAGSRKLATVKSDDWAHPWLCAQTQMKLLRTAVCTAAAHTFTSMHAQAAEGKTL